MLGTGLMSIKNMKNLAPIVLFVYNRPLHTQQVLDALSKNTEAADSILYIYCDGPKSDASTKQLEKIKEVCRIAKSEKRFKEVQVIYRKENMGLATSVIAGVTEIVNKYGKIIILEDDLVASPYFLKFMNDALNMYKTNNDVACISGYIYPVKEKLSETFFIKGADCWGWATWKRAWRDFEKDGEKLLNELENKGLSYEFDFDNSYNYTQMLREQVSGKNSSWAIRWYASAFLKDKLCLYPGTSLIQNIGIDGSGTHSGNSDKWIVDIASHPINIKPIAVVENNVAKKMIISYFQESNKNEHIVKKIIKIIYRKIFAQSPKYGWFGDYNNWEDAKKKCTGYDDSTILEKVKAALLKVKNGEAVYERDSVLFDELPYSEPLINAFQNIAIENGGSLHIVDFGGSLGSSYFQNRTFLKNLKELKWDIVEQKHFVDCGKEFFEEEQLKFYYTIEEAIKNNKPTVLLLSSVIQYFENPKALIQKCMDYNFDYIIIDRTSFIEKNKDRITVQIVPESIYKASYPAWFFNEQDLLDIFKNKYEIINSFLSDLSKPMNIDKNTKAYWKGFVLKKYNE